MRQTVFVVVGYSLLTDALSGSPGSDYDLTLGIACDGCSVSLVGIDVHSGSKSGAYSYDYVTENELSAFAADSNADDLFILESVVFSCLCIKMDMSLSSDNAL